MQPSTISANSSQGPSGFQTILRFGLVVGLLYVFLIAINGLGSGFKSLGGGLLDAFFTATENPFMGLVVGLLATTLVQSSSVTTALIVAMVAAPDNQLPIANAIPMVMGANIGTTVTATIVSLGHMGRPDEFRRAFAVATCHDFFNVLAVAVLLPVEIATGYLRTLATAMATTFSGVGGVKYDSPIKGAIKAGAEPLQKVVTFVSDSSQIRAVVLIVICGLLIYGALFALVKVMRVFLRRKMEGAVINALDKQPVLAMIIGAIVTAMVQSSSITTSLLVPLAGAGVITLAQAFPVTIGANIGTTVTALLASLAVSGANASAGVTIAFVHLLFNLAATVLIYPVKRIRAIPLGGATKLATVAVKNRLAALVCVVIIFYVIPIALAVLNR